eukprot:TRINITY_DN7711_c0_g1_i1.p1 TRINITY_DN7711_c0_g1~~TRINITY_DN7711_c0_g1_i1.p1  ORF type:complete len:793 (+),score=141.93 TRINITY_DN7711_c0_g1_i1:36-2414(+)
MASLIRGKVSKNKRRFVDKKNGFDLDLSYITDKIIAMGFPSENMEGIYRNNMADVIRFLDSRHGEHYKVYNLCSERAYDHQKFYNRVEVFPFDDHNAPRFELIEEFCQNVEAWLSSHEENIVAIHCKAGKGRTGVMICSWLLYNKMWNDADEVLKFYAAMRTFNMKGVTIPSQIRYIKYFNQSKRDGCPEPQSLVITRIVLHKDLKYENDIKFKVYELNEIVYKYHAKCQKIKSAKKKEKPKDDSGPNEDEERIIFDIDDCPTLSGDIKVVFFDTGRVGVAGKVLFTFWFNTRFIQDKHVIYQKEELDKANKDKSHKSFNKQFNVELTFAADGEQTENKKEIVYDGLTKPYSYLNESSNSAILLGDLAYGLLRDLIGTIAALSADWNDITAKTLALTAESEDFETISEGIQRLNQMDFNSLKNSRDKLAFWLNVFHLLFLYSLSLKAKEEKFPDLLQERFGFLNSSVFSICGSSFTLLEILFSCLLPTFSIPEKTCESESEVQTPKFAKSDVRGQAGLSKADLRLMCVIWQGLRHGPPFPIFSPLSVNEDIDDRTRKFINRSVEIDGNGDVLLPIEFACYSEGQKSGKTFIRWLAEYHPQRQTQKQLLQKQSKPVFHFKDQDQFSDSSVFSLSIVHLKREFISYLPQPRQQEAQALIEKEEKSTTTLRDRRTSSVSFMENLKLKRTGSSPNSTNSAPPSPAGVLAASDRALASADSNSNSSLTSSNSMDSLPVVGRPQSVFPLERSSLMSTPSTPMLSLARGVSSNSVTTTPSPTNAIGASSLRKNENEEEA